MRRPFSYHSSNFLIIALFLRRFSRSDIFAPVEATGISLVLLNPSHVLVVPILSMVAEPTFDGFWSSNPPISIFFSLSEPRENTLLKPLGSFPPEGADSEEGAESTVLDKLFNSSSKLSRSPISTFVEALDEILFSFINNSTPGPKLTEGVDLSVSFRLKSTGSRLSKPISMTSILMLK